MNWNVICSALLIVTSFHLTIAHKEEATQNATTLPVNSPVALDDNLRSALLEALSDLEKEDSDDDKNIEKAQVSAVTIVANNDNHTQFTENDPQEPSKQNTSLLFQESRSIHSHLITSVENKPLDPIKDVEQIVTSASNSFVTKNDDVPETIKSTKESENKKANRFASPNSIFNTELKKPSTIVEKFSIGKAVDEPDFIKTYVRPVGLKLVDTKANNDAINNSSEPRQNKLETSEEVTEAALQVSTEENEAKVEQVQFFSAPLVAAFTVHQDEQGLPKKVEPIYKNGLEKPKSNSNINQEIPQATSQSILQTSSFNQLNLQQKQQILEQELANLRKQQQTTLTRSNFAAPETSNQLFTVTGFNQAVNQNFNQFDPIFTEPDRSVVTKLATIDPNSLLKNPSPLLNKFMPNEAIIPIASNQIKEETTTLKQGSKLINDVSLVSSISFDPLVEAGKLPKNAQILPNKPPTGFHSFLKFPKAQSNQFQPNNFVQPNAIPVFNRFENFQAQFGSSNRFLRQEQGTGNLGLNQNSFSIVPAQQPFAPRHELGYFPNNNGFVAKIKSEPQQVTRPNFFGQNQNRFFRPNPDGAQNIHIQPSVQPFGVQPLISTSRLNPSQNTRILRSNPENSILNNRILQNYRYTNSFGFHNVPFN